MASKVRPKQHAKYKGRVISAPLLKKHVRRFGNSEPILRALTLVWVQANGVPFNTSGGFIAQLSRGGVVVATTAFDDFGVARFNNIPTLTRVSFRLTIFDLQGRIFRIRTLPAGIEAFAIIG